MSAPQHFTFFLLHACALLEQPQLGSPVIALLDARTMLDVRAQTAGFYVVTVGKHQGFVPIALCTVDLTSHHPHYYHLLATRRETTLLAQAQADATPLQWVLPAHHRMRLLGQHQGFFLLQDAKGRLGFVPSSRDTYRSTTFATEARSCLYDVGWPGMGCSWVVVNALGLVGFLTTIPFTSWLFDTILSTVIGGVVLVMISRRRFQDTRGMFIFGAQMALGGLVLLGLASLLLLLNP